MPRNHKHPHRKGSNKRRIPHSVCRYSPVWQLAASRFGNNRWIVFSLELLRLVILYSDLEYGHVVIVESNYQIISYCEQPLRLRVSANQIPIRRPCLLSKILPQCFSGRRATRRSIVRRSTSFGGVTRGEKK